MLAESVVAVFLLGWFVCFFSVNLHSIAKGQKLRRDVKVYAEVERPPDFAMGLATFGTIVYFLEVLSYLFLVFTDLISVLHDSPFIFRFPFVSYMQILGLILTSAGYFVFIWSVVARGRYSVSWKMPENQRLVTWGPYRCVRHPSYLGYFLMFLGLFFIWHNLFTVFPLSRFLDTTALLLMRRNFWCNVSVRSTRSIRIRLGDSFPSFGSHTLGSLKVAGDCES